MKVLTINNLEDTQILANKLAALVSTPAYICLSGDLGAGKTTFTKYFAKALGIDDTITSPTFQIMKLYEVDDVQLCHIDAYRLEGLHQDLGFEEIMEDSINVIEWYDYIAEVLPAQRLEINIKLDDDKRYFEIKGIGAAYQSIEEAL